MISIRRYMQGNEKAHDKLLQLAQLLIEGMESHAVEGPPGELAHFRVLTRRVLASLESQADPAEVLALGANAMDALGQHNRNAVEYLRAPTAELQAKVTLLTEAIASIASSSTENIHRLHEMKGKLLATVDVKEIRSLRQRLSLCLDGIMAEAQRQRSEMDRVAENLNRPSRPAGPSRDAEVPATDAATGLPARAQAEECIAQCCQGEAAAFVAIMVINQAETLNRSVGGQYADIILHRFAEYIREELPRIDEVFRWSGPTVVALLRRRSALDVRCMIEPLLLQRLTVRVGNPAIQVPISARWTVLPLVASPRLLFRKMDVFAGTGSEMENADFADS